MKVEVRDDNMRIVFVPETPKDGFELGRRIAGKACSVEENLHVEGQPIRVSFDIRDFFNEFWTLP